MTARRVAGNSPTTESARVEIFRGVTSWAEGCQARRPCSIGAPRPKPCTPGETRSVSEVLGHAASLAGHRVSVRGLLGVEGGGMTLVDCSNGPPKQCCNGASGAVVLAEEGQGDRLRLRGLGCWGDESAQCCNAPAYGQPVVAMGRFEATTAWPVEAVTAWPGGSGWGLGDVVLCAPH
jgi:hypothetical protein